MKLLTLLSAVTLFGSCRPGAPDKLDESGVDQSTEDSSSVQILEAVECKSYNGSLRLIAYGRLLKSYHPCVVNEQRAATAVATTGDDHVSSVDAIEVAQEVVKEKIQLYSSGADIRVERLELAKGGVHLVYFSKRVPARIGQPVDQQPYVSMMIPVYDDGTFELPIGI